MLRKSTADSSLVIFCNEAVVISRKSVVVEGKLFETQQRDEPNLNCDASPVRPLIEIKIGKYGNKVFFAFLHFILDPVS